MKRLFLIITLAAATAAICNADDFGRGYELGWKEGYRKAQGQFAIAPICPIPPIPPIGEDTFFGGYNEGFLAGLSEGEE